MLFYMIGALNELKRAFLLTVRVFAASPAMTGRITLESRNSRIPDERIKQNSGLQITQ